MLTGKTVFGYKVVSSIHSGTSGTVYCVEKNNQMGSFRRALKHISFPSAERYAQVLNSMGGDRNKANGYFECEIADIANEINILNAISQEGDNRYIVAYYENEVEKTESPLRYDIYILMELLTPLTDHISARGATVSDILRYGRDILNALIICRRNNIVHRDIKEDNLFISRKGTCKLGDFGISKVAADYEMMRSKKYTPNYCAPEVWHGKAGYSHTVDIYALGIVLYRMLNDMRNPFLPEYPAEYTQSDEEKAFALRLGEAIPARPRNAQNELGDVVLRAISPAKVRFASAEDFLAAIDAAEKKMSSAELNTVVLRGSEPAAPTAPIPAAEQDRNTVGSTVAGQGNFVRRFGNQKADPYATIPFARNDRKAAESAEKKQPTPHTPEESEADPESYPEARQHRFTPQPQPEKNTSDIISWVMDKTSKVPNKLAVVFSKLKSTGAYIAPLVVLVLYLIVYRLIAPAVFEEGLSYFTWLFSDTETILERLLDKISDPDAVERVVTFAGKYLLIFKVMHYIFSAAFIASLYFFARRLHFGKPAVSSKAVLVGNDPYMLVTEIRHKLKAVGCSPAVSREIGIVADRLRNESAFGTGSDRVIACETEISEIISKMRDLAERSGNNGNSENIERKLIECCRTLTADLKLRAELKKK